MKDMCIYYRFECDVAGSNDFILRERLSYGPSKNCFKTKEEARFHFDNAKKIALKKYENILEGLKKIKESLGDFSYEYYILGDTYGIYDEGMYISFEVNGYDFEFRQ